MLAESSLPIRCISPGGSACRLLISEHKITGIMYLPVVTRVQGKDNASLVEIDPWRFQYKFRIAWLQLYISVLTMQAYGFFFLSLYVSPPKGAIGYETTGL